MKELDTMKQLKPHPYVIKLLGCAKESGIHFASDLLCNTFSSMEGVTASQLSTTNNHRIS